MYVFFFQAEDGIRDGHVTGVQTCALPICPVSKGQGSVHRGELAWAFSARPSPLGREYQVRIRQRRVMSPNVVIVSPDLNERSEERRVGKECRSRWWRYQ